MPLDVPSIIIWGTVALALIITAFAAAAEMAMASLSRARLKQMTAEGISPAQRIADLLTTPGRFLTTLLQLKVLAIAAAATAVTYWAAQRAMSIGSLVLLQFLLAMIFVLTQTAVRALVVANAEKTAFLLISPLRWLTTLFTPFTWLHLTVASKVRRQGEDDAADESIFLSEDGLRFLMNVSEGESLIEEGEKEMIASIFELGKTLVREVMVPRIDLVALEVDTDIQEALDVILSAGHSRIPIYEDSVDNIIGVLYAKDLLRVFRNGQSQIQLRNIVREPYFVPESKPVDELLRELQQRRVHMAIIVDEYGGTAGVVTIEDLLEEIVGDIQDEYDREEPEIQELGDGEFLLNARVSLDEVNELLDVELPSDGGDTLGGFIYSQLGKVPHVGEEVHFAHVTMRVLTVDGNRIDQVRAWIDRNPPETPQAAEPTEDPPLVQPWGANRPRPAS
jgi:CBS domain containing-hemolysin-like protein